MVEIEIQQPFGARLVGQQEAELLGLDESRGLQNTLNEQLETARLASMQQKSEAVTLGCPQNVVDMETPFWQRKLGVLGLEGFCNLRSMLDAQRDKIHQQLQELQKVVVLQCQITGTNPLAQEMAAAVLDKRIGKRFGESLSPKALKCLYNVFSIKDTITKKEAREISALCGATVTEVREFFAGQRSRVRKVVQSSYIDRGSSNMLLKLQSAELDQSTISSQFVEDTSSLSAQQVESRQCNYLLLLDAFRGREGGISTKQHAVEKAEHLINAMHKEDTFTGQSQLAQVIMEAHESVLRCFMARGGLQLINKWLSQAAAEEQTSLMRVMLKTLMPLPLGSALPRHMSLLLQTVNKLRFYRAQDIASRSRLLLSRWSRFLKSSLSGKVASLAGLTRTAQPGQKRTRDPTHSPVVKDTCKKKVKADTSVDLGQSADLVSSSLTGDKTVPQRDKPEAVTEINKTKKRVGSFLIQGDRAKEKRKVQLFEGSQVATRRKDVEGTRSSSFEPSSRPLSADDIRKAKRRAYFLGKSQNAPTPRLDELMTLDLWPFSAEKEQRKVIRSTGGIGPAHKSSKGDNFFGNTPNSVEERSASKLRSNLKVSDVLAGQHADSSASISREAFGMVNLQGQISEGHKATGGEVTSGLASVILSSKKQSEVEDIDAMDMPSILWMIPPRVSLDPRWKTASGEHSTEIVQETNRLRNEIEAIYLSPQLIPSSPAEPAERLCLFVDDALVPEILLEAVEEESPEKDGCLQSPRFDSAKSGGEQEDIQKLMANMDSKAQGEAFFLRREGLDSSVALEMPLSNTLLSEPTKTEDQQPPLVAESTEMNHMQRLNIAAVDPAKNLCLNPSELTLATPIEHMHKEMGMFGYGNSEVYLKHRGASCLQTENGEAVPISREQDPSVVVRKDPADKPSLNNVWKKDIPSVNQDQPEGKTTTTTTTAVDLSGLSKEDCMDMLDIVLQQLTDNAKASGADPELLSVFLKNPQLVYSLMSSHVGPSGNGSSSVSSGMHLTKVMACSPMGDINSEHEKLGGRDIGAVPNTGSLVEKTSPLSSQFAQPVRPSIPMTNPHPHSHPPQSLQVIDQQVQLPIKESKTFDDTHFLKHPSSVADTSSDSLDYDWSQPYDYPANSMQQGAEEEARQLMRSSKVADNCLSQSAYSHTPPGYIQSHFMRASLSQNPSKPLAPTDLKLHSSMLMYDGDDVDMGAISVHNGERDERILNRRNGFPVVNSFHSRSLRSGAMVSDGLLPVPGMASTNLSSHSSLPPHHRHPLHGGELPPFVSDIKGTTTLGGSHPPLHVSNGHNYYDPSFRPPSDLNSFLPSAPHAQLPWRPSHARSSLSKHARPARRREI